MLFKYVISLNINVLFRNKFFVFSFYRDKSRREDKGKYELTLRNAKGEIKIPIDVTVLGKIILNICFFGMKIFFF